MVQQPFAMIPKIPTANDLIEIAYRRSIKVSPPIPFRASRIIRVKRLSEARIRALSDILCSKLNSIYKLFPSSKLLHPFYKALLEILIPLNQYDNLRRKLRSSVKIIRRISNEYIQKIKQASTVEEVQKLRKEAYGRILSVIKRIKKHLYLLEEVRATLHKVPSIDPQELIIVVAGYPNVGKSTFVSKISTAKPKIAEYPFTTTEIIVGHIVLNNLRIQIIDTPGLLDRPLSERNNIERMAIAAIQYLADSIIFILDPSETSGYPLKEQLSLLEEIKNTFPQTPILPVLNKIDVASLNQILLCEKALNMNLLKMVAKDGKGVHEVLSYAVKLALKSKSP